MAWSSEEFIKYGKALKQRNKPANQNERDIVEHDLSVINCLLKEIGDDTVFEKNYESTLFIESGISKEKIIEFLMKTSVEIINIPYSLWVKGIDKTQENLLFDLFLMDIDSELYDIYLNIVKNNNIRFNKNKKSISYIQNIISFSKQYILLKDSKFSSFSLIHELGHAKQYFHCEKDINKHVSLYSSIFAEAYPIYLSLQWAKFLKDFGYIDLYLKIKQDLITNLSIYFQYIKHLISIDVNVNNNKCFMNLLSNILVMYFDSYDENTVFNINNTVLTSSNNENFIMLKEKIKLEELRKSIISFIEIYRNEFNNRKILKKEYRG